MKRILLMSVAIVAVLVSACKKPQTQTTQETVAVSLEVTGIADNSATINVNLTSGSFYGAKIIKMINRDEVTINLDSEIQLTNYVIENGEDLESLPYTETISGVRIGQDKFTAVIVYDATGRAADVEYVVWIPAGLPEGWSTDNGAGELGEIKW